MSDCILVGHFCYKKRLWGIDRKGLNGFHLTGFETNNEFIFVLRGPKVFHFPPLMHLNLKKINLKNKTDC